MPDGGKIFNYVPESLEITVKLNKKNLYYEKYFPRAVTSTVQCVGYNASTTYSNVSATSSNRTCGPLPALEIFAPTFCCGIR